MMRLVEKVFYVFLLIQLLSCGAGLTRDTETGNPQTLVDLKIVGIDSSVSTKKQTKALPGGIDVTEARIVLKEIEFKPLQSCQEEGNGEFDFDGPFVVDLLNNTSTPDTETVQLVDDTYCKVKLKLAKLEIDEVPFGIDSSDPIVESSVIIQGMRSDNTVFTVLIKQDDEFKIENEQDGFVVDSDTGANQFFIAFDLALWFDLVDMDGATIDGGQITIDEGNNTSLYEQIVDNIKTSAKLFEDINENGSLDDDEDDDNDILGSGGDDD